MPIDLSSSSKILTCAKSLDGHLAETRLESRGKVWTDHNFSRLRAFFQDDKDVTCYPHPRISTDDATAEFMWDFLAIQANGGIVLAAESEQDHRNVSGLKHDFEKLLYVFAPLRLLISKAETTKEAVSLASSLAEYAKGSCLNFNPGSIFILHFDLWNDAGSVSYLWQSKGEPAKLEAEVIDFGKPNFYVKEPSE